MQVCKRGKPAHLQVSLFLADLGVCPFCPDSPLWEAYSVLRGLFKLALLYVPANASVMAHILTVVAKLKGKWRRPQPLLVARFSSGFSGLPQGDTRPSCILGDQSLDSANPGSLCGAPSPRGARGLTPGPCVIPKGDTIGAFWA